MFAEADGPQVRATTAAREKDIKFIMCGFGQRLSNRQEAKSEVPIPRSVHPILYSDAYGEGRDIHWRRK
jgi:hypothetical protein